jgi:hypothetical protein
VKIWLALIDIALTNASICYFLANPELKKKEWHRRRYYAVIAKFLVDQGDTFDGEENWEAKTMMSTRSSHNATVTRS